MTQACSLCSAPLASTINLGNESFEQFECGHMLPAPPPATVNYDSVDKSKSGRPYQREGVDFIIESGFNCIIGDQMRLGKTPQSLLALKNDPSKLPCLILVRSANLWQWIYECKTWVTNHLWGVCPIIGSKSFIPPGFQIYIMSMDTFGRKGMTDRLLEFGFKLVIVDEAHSFKNEDSQRSKALVTFLESINTSELTQEVPVTCMMCKHQWTETVTIKSSVANLDRKVYKHTCCPKCYAQCSFSAGKHIKVERSCSCVFLTGTAIKNRADELYIPLHIVAPDIAPDKHTFRQRWLQQDSKGKWSRISDRRKDLFKESIKPYFLRREKQDVYTDLPELNRNFTLITIEDEKLKKAYNAALDRIETTVSLSGTLNIFNSIGELQILRQICGQAKIPWAKQYADDFLEDNEKAKLAIGIHHKGVRDTLAYMLRDHGVLTLSGEDNAERKYWVMKNFETRQEQVCVLNMLAGGVGMDFHYVDNVLILERQWSAADEEQFEFRFYNPDKSIKDRSTFIEYCVAKGTIDEFFYDLIEEKRGIFGETLGTNWSMEQDETSFKQLVERTLSSRL